MRACLNITFIGSVSLTALLMGCAPGLEQFEDRRRQSAPASPYQTGQLVQGASQEDLAQLLKKNPQLEFRMINARHGLFEVYGAELELLESHLPGTRINENHYISLPQSQNLTLQNKDCSDKSNNSSEAFIQILSPTHLSSGERIRLGQTIKLRAVGELEQVSWTVGHPTGSMRALSQIDSRKLTFQPDSLGIYTFVLKGYKPSGICQSQQLQVVVTDNPVFTPPNEASILKHKEQHPHLLFSHLNEVKALDAWDFLNRSQSQPYSHRSEGSEPVLIAIIDSGTNYNHPALAQNIYINYGEIPNNQIDDDGNGFVDDVLGYDFRNGDPYPFDDSGHGSHVAGLAASSHFGIAREARILSIKVLDGLGGDLGSLAGGIYYAVDQGAQIINISAGYYQIVSPIVNAAVQYAEAHNVLIVAAAGNGMGGFGVNNDRVPMFPASLPNSNVVSVAAKDEFGILASYSNFGVNTVDLVAPGGSTIGGQRLKSTFKANPQGIAYNENAGTSMAAPLVAGAAANMLQFNPNLSAAELRRLLRQSGSPDENLARYIGSGRFFSALDALKLSEPAH